MKQIIIIIFISAALYSCKENSNHKKTQKQESLTFKNDSVSKSFIKVFSIVFDSIYTNDSRQLTLLNSSLRGLYKEDSFIHSKENLQRQINDYKSKKFEESLAKDFNNNAFTKATQINVSFLTKEQQDVLGNIRVEEWFFKDEKTAESCFKSLASYGEREIHFKTINWIWVQQKNKIFLISTADYAVDSEPMQSIKQHLINILKQQGEYNIIEML